MIRRTNLPDSILLPTGEVLEPVIGGHLQHKPFLTLEHSGVDVTKNGWAIYLPIGGEESAIIAEAKRLKLKYRRVQVLSRRNRLKYDPWDRKYNAATQWVFVEVK
jgi:hypothetical protein